MKEFTELLENFINPDNETTNLKKSKLLGFYTDFSQLYTTFNAYYIENYGDIAETQEKELYAELNKKLSRVDNSFKNLMSYQNGDFDSLDSDNQEEDTNTTHSETLKSRQTEEE